MGRRTQNTKTASVELIRVCVVREGDRSDKSVCCPADVVPWLSEIADSDREHFVCFHLNAKNEVLSMEIVSIGTLNVTVLHPREVFKSAILKNAASVILAHNHPSGSLTPSEEDIAITMMMMKAGEILGIQVLDHIIVSFERHLSMKEAGLI